MALPAGPGIERSAETTWIRVLARSSVRTTPVTAATVVGVMDVVRQLWPLLQPAGIAVLTPLEVDPAALTAHAIADAEDMPLKVFRSYDDAVEWLRRSVSK